MKLQRVGWFPIQSSKSLYEKLPDGQELQALKMYHVMQGTYLSSPDLSPTVLSAISYQLHLQCERKQPEDNYIFTLLHYTLPKSISHLSVTSFVERLEWDNRFVQNFNINCNIQDQSIREKVSSFTLCRCITCYYVQGSSNTLSLHYMYYVQGSSSTLSLHYMLLCPRTF